MDYAYASGNASRLMSVTNLPLTVDAAAGYDTWGNLRKYTLQGVAYELNFNAENRLASVKVGTAQPTVFAYDADGQRVQTTYPDGTILYTPFPDYEVEVPPTGALTTRTTYRLGGQIVALQTKVGTAAGTFYYTYSDHLGNVAALSSKAGAFTTGSLARYEPFGNHRTTPATTTNPAITNHGFTGHRHNNTGVYPTQNVGLIYMNARYYLPEVGRFISADTIVPEPSNPQSYNRYSYTRNNPVNFTDPTGHRECIDELCDLVWNEQTNRPNLRGPLPTAIGYIFGEMTANATTIAANVIHTGNIIADIPFATGTSRAMGYLIANAVWGSQVMDARLKERVGALAPYIANWDHKPILRGITGPSPVPEIVERGNSSGVGAEFYRFDIWSNIHYGYVGVASGFSESELINGAGAEQIGSVLYSGGQPSSSPNSPTWLSSWDEPSDTASIQIGSALWNNYGLNVTPADLYLAVIDETRLCSTQCLGAGQ